MKKSISVYIILLFFTPNILGGEITKNYDFKDFTGVSVGWGMNLNVEQSDEFSITIRGDEADFRYLKVIKSGNMLKIYVDKNSYRFEEDMFVNITMPYIDILGLGGGARGNIEMDIASDPFDLDLSGGATLNGKLNCGNIEVDLSGGSVIKLNGNAGDLNFDASGGSVAKLNDFKARDVNADLSGGSELYIYVNGSLEGDLSGGSKIIYNGNPTDVSTSSSGGSIVRKE